MVSILNDLTLQTELWKNSGIIKCLDKKIKYNNVKTTTKQKANIKT